MAYFHFGSAKAVETDEGSLCTSGIEVVVWNVFGLNIPDLDLVYIE